MSRNQLYGLRCLVMVKPTRGTVAMTKSQALRTSLYASCALIALDTLPVQAQLLPVDPNNSVLIDLGAIDGAAPSPRGRALPVAPGAAPVSGG